MRKTTFVRHSITAEAAEAGIAAAIARANTISSPSSIAVVDESGRLKAFVRMDGAPLASIQVSQDKAYTAAGFAMPTSAWERYLSGDQVLAVGSAHVERMIVFGGGIPIQGDVNLVGAVGASGGTYDQDEDVAQAAVDAMRTWEHP